MNNEKKAQDAKAPEKPVKIKKTRSIARGINWEFSARLLFIFILIDVIILFPELTKFIDGSLPFKPEQFVFLFETKKTLFIAEALIWLLGALFGASGIRKKLRPLDEMASATRFLMAGGGFDETKFHNLTTAIDRVNPTREGARIRMHDKELEGLETAVNKLIERIHDSYSQQARFVSDASHELRTPIAVIQGYANMLDRWGKADEKVLSESIDAIKAESERMKRMVEQLLFLARGDSGKIPIKNENLDLSVTIREIFDESVMINSKHKFELQAAAPVYALGDADMLRQAARTLVENAVKYTPEGGTVILKAETRGEASAITVQDYGIGMSQEDLPHVFDRFYRADASRTRGSGGSGLGLAIAKWIADRHGGWFEILSREELGTRISLCLPAASMAIVTTE